MEKTKTNEAIIILNDGNLYSRKNKNKITYD